MDQVLFSSKTYEHHTDPEIVRAVESVGPIFLDPCGSPGSYASNTAQMVFFPPPNQDQEFVIDGLGTDWSIHVPSGPGSDALAYWNPPYGRYTCPFLKASVPRCGKCGNILKGGCQAFLAREAFGNHAYNAKCDCRLWKRTVNLWVEHAARQTCNSIGLLPARTDTAWFHGPICHGAHAICLFKGRRKFGSAKNSAPFPSLAVLYQKTNPFLISKFAQVFREFGKVIIL